jgi:fructoselysine-6-P-deglycase FrlB-like protein
MRRKLRRVPYARQRAITYTCCLIALLGYAIPRIPPLAPGVAGTFSFVWILFAALAVAANVYFLVGADKERSRMIEARTQDIRMPGEPMRVPEPDRERGLR